MGGGGANLLDSPKNAGNSDFDSPNLDNEEPQDYAITYKTYEDYYIDFQIPTKLLGKGTELSPYQINTTEDFLFLIKTSMSGCFFEINTDIILNDETFDENGTPSGGDGVVYNWGDVAYNNNISINGKGHSIKGFYYNNELENKTALFGGNTLKKVENLNFENVYLFGKLHTSILSWRVAEIKECKILSGNVYGAQEHTGSYVSAFCNGFVTEISDCENYANVYGKGTSTSAITTTVLFKGKILRCKNYGNITGGWCTGGITGYNHNTGLMMQCENYGTITGETHVGGISAMITEPDTEIRECINYGKIVSRSSCSSGIVSWTYKSCSLISCANFGDLEGVRKTNLIANVNPRVGEKVILTIDDCHSCTRENYPYFGSFNDSSAKDNRKVEYNVSNCTVDFDKSKEKQGFVLFGNDAYKHNIELNIDNLYVKGKNCEKIELYAGIKSKSIVNIKNVLVEAKNITVDKSMIDCDNTTTINIESIVVLNKENAYFGSDFSGYYVDFKTGKIGLKSMSGKGFFQGAVTEDVLKAKGFIKKTL